MGSLKGLFELRYLLCFLNDNTINKKVSSIDKNGGKILVTVMGFAHTFANCELDPSLLIEKEPVFRLVFPYTTPVLFASFEA